MTGVQTCALPIYGEVLRDAEARITSLRSLLSEKVTTCEEKNVECLTLSEKLRVAVVQSSEAIQIQRLVAKEEERVRLQSIFEEERNVETELNNLKEKALKENICRLSKDLETALDDIQTLTKEQSKLTIELEEAKVQFSSQFTENECQILSLTKQNNDKEAESVKIVKLNEDLTCDLSTAREAYTAAEREISQTIKLKDRKSVV